MILFIEADFVDEQDTNKETCYRINKNKQNKLLSNWRISLNSIKNMRGYTYERQHQHSKIELGGKDEIKRFEQILCIAFYENIIFKLDAI